MADQSVQENTDLAIVMVQRYMNVVHDSILDMTPKFIIMSLVQATMRYAQKSLIGDLLPVGTTKEEFERLTETSAEDKRRLEQILAKKKATEKALEIVTSISSDRARPWKHSSGWPLSIILYDTSLFT